MNDNYIEAQESIRNDEYQGDKERERVAEEDRYEDMTIMEKIDVITQKAQELDEMVNEKEHKFYWDSKFAI